MYLNQELSDQTISKQGYESDQVFDIFQYLKVFTKIVQKSYWIKFLAIKLYYKYFN